MVDLVRNIYRGDEFLVNSDLSSEASLCQSENESGIAFRRVHTKQPQKIRFRVLLFLSINEP